MSYLDTLLQGVEVEWKTLGDVSEIIRGVRITKKDLLPDGIYPVVSGGVGFMGYINQYNRDADTITIAQYGTAGYVKWQPEKFWANDVCFCIKPNTEIILNRYLYFYLVNKQQYLYDISNRTAVPYSIERDKILKLQIPIPPLSVQKEIVGILDKMTKLTAELKAELTARKKQYNYYREQLLSFEEGEVEWKTLEEVALDFGRGKSKHRPRNDERLYGGNFPFIQTGDIRNASHVILEHSQTYSDFGLKQSKLWPKGTLCITIAANIAETTILGFDACFPDSIIGFVANPVKTNSNYVEYLLTSLKGMLEDKGQGSAQSNINLGTFENLKFPFPPLEEQERIVSILDKFDILTTSISEGLPKEIKLRKQQYEYYRNMLLTFPKHEN